MENKILRVQAQTPIKTVQVKSEEGKQTAVCTLMVQELGGKWAVFVVVGQCLVAWVVALAVRLIGLAVGLG